MTGVKDKLISLFPNLTLRRTMSSCIFCKIVAGDAPSEKYYEDEEIIVFKDIKPASKFHLLSIPKQHILNINSLTHKDIPLINRLIEKGKQVIEEQGGDINDIRFGFHCPPFNSVSHLHLHVIAPVAEMSYLSGIIFKQDSWWFMDVYTLLKKLENKPMDNKL